MEIESKKLIELEAVRGIAALVVLVHHFMLGFAPHTHGLLFPQEQGLLFGTPLFAFVNGTASVVLFFVLSGFVLTYRSIGSARARPLVSGAIKRWPRLALLIVTVNVISGLLLVAGLYRNVAVSPITGSPWLEWFFAKSPYSLPPPIAAVYEGAFATFFYGANYFNSSLWTMYFEFFGSFLAFGFAYLCIVLRPLGLLLATIAIIPIVVYLSPYFLCFIAGVSLAKVYSSHTTWERWAYAANESRSKPLWLTLCAILIITLYGYHEPLFGSREPTGLYKFMTPIAALDAMTTRVVLHTIAAVLILSLALTLRGSRHWLGGRLGALLGMLSFPIYLMHVIVICSVGSWVYFLLLPFLSKGPLLAVTFLCTAVVTVAASFALANLDRWWLQTLRRWNSCMPETYLENKMQRSPLAGGP